MWEIFAPSLHVWRRLAAAKPAESLILDSSCVPPFSFSALNFAFLEHPQVECGKTLGWQLIRRSIFGELAVLTPRMEYISAEHNHF